MAIIKINFSDLGGPAYIGREKGKNARKKLNIDMLEDGDNTFIIIIPDDTYSINSSYFLGLFGESVKKSASIDAFFNKFDFKMPERMIVKIQDYVSRALHEGGPLI
ncbi:MAG: hypothetical protein OEW99_00445 [Gammaproteobacteria bacterium]|nr:hypothetical protein [Gammaproteobacteria bacterium]